MFSAVVLPWNPHPLILLAKLGSPGKSWLSELFLSIQEVCSVAAHASDEDHRSGGR